MFKVGDKAIVRGASAYTMFPDETEVIVDRIHSSNATEVVGTAPDGRRIFQIISNIDLYPVPAPLPVGSQMSLPNLDGTAAGDRNVWSLYPLSYEMPSPAKEPRLGIDYAYPAVRKCECGVESVGSNNHSDYCPKYEA